MVGAMGLKLRKRPPACPVCRQLPRRFAVATCSALVLLVTLMMLLDRGKFALRPQLSLNDAVYTTEFHRKMAVAAPTQAFIVLVVFGTRPEVIKMVPVIRALESRGIVTVTCDTGQHVTMLKQHLEYFRVQPDVNLNLMHPEQTLPELAARAHIALDRAITTVKPHIVLVQGDTTTALVAAEAAFYHHIPVGHVEAGLRTYQRYSPFPEEMNRMRIGIISTFHFAPTTLAASRLRAEGVAEASLFVTGNPVIDSLVESLSKPPLRGDEAAMLDEALDGVDRKFLAMDVSADARAAAFAKGRFPILVTVHRRESFGAPMEAICRALKRVAKQHPRALLIVPVHLNPRVQATVGSALRGIDNIRLLAPLTYPVFTRLLAHIALVVSDSGGIQEEAVFLGKPVLILRRSTERMEGVLAGAARLVGDEEDAIVAACNELITDSDKYRSMASNTSVYGTGDAGQQIGRIIASKRSLIRQLPTLMQSEHNTRFSSSSFHHDQPDAFVPDLTSNPEDQKASDDSWNGPIVSIVLPVYNMEKFVEMAVTSCLRQTFESLEVVIVDDGSTDGTVEYLESIKNHERVHVIKQQNAFLPAALNTGHKAAKGKYLTWTSADNVYTEDAIEMMMKGFERFPEVGFVGADMYHVSETGERLFTNTRRTSTVWSLLCTNSFGSGAFLYRREIYEAAGLYNVDLEGVEDWDYWLRTAEKGPVLHLNKAIYSYLVHGGSMTATKVETITGAREKMGHATYARYHNGDFDVHEMYRGIRFCVHLDKCVRDAAIHSAQLQQFGQQPIVKSLLPANVSAKYKLSSLSGIRLRPGDSELIWLEEKLLKTYNYDPFYDQDLPRIELATVSGSVDIGRGPPANPNAMIANFGVVKASPSMTLTGDKKGLVRVSAEDGLACNNVLKARKEATSPRVVVVVSEPIRKGATVVDSCLAKLLPTDYVLGWNSGRNEDNVTTSLHALDLPVLASTANGIPPSAHLAAHSTAKERKSNMAFLYHVMTGRDYRNDPQQDIGECTLYEDDKVLQCRALYAEQKPCPDAQ